MRALWLAAPLLLASVLLALAMAPAGEVHAVHQSRDKCYHCPDDLLVDPTVPPDWQFIPSGILPGESFRLLFVTPKQVTPSDEGWRFSYFDYYANLAAADNGRLGQYHAAFQAVVSCGYSDARDHTSTRGEGVPIYWLNGAKVADDYQDFWDGSWDSNEPRNRSGNVLESAHVHTGTRSDGTHDTYSICGGLVIYGLPHQPGSEIAAYRGSGSQAGSVYALSTVFTVSVNPAAPGRPSVSSVTPDSATMTWSAPRHPGATPIFDYNVQIKRAADSSWVGSTPYHWGTDTTHTLTGLSPDTQYQVRVFAKNHGAGGSDVGYGPASPVTTFHTKTVEPSAPGKPRVTPLETTATVKWTAPAWPGSPAFHDYDLSVTPAPGVDADIDGTATTFTLTGLESDTTYRVQVRANNSAGSGHWSPAATFHTLSTSQVPADWQLKPESLGEGDLFRLLFASSRTSENIYNNLSYYDQAVRNAAGNGHEAIVPYASEVKAVMSTISTNARDTTKTSALDTAIPIYWLNGAKVADDYGDFWDGCWDSNEPRDENGDSVQENTRVWTATKSNGYKADPYHYAGSVSPAYGDPTVDCKEIWQHYEWRANQHRVYGITDVFLVGP